MTVPAGSAYSAQLSKDLLDAGKRAADTLNTLLTIHEPWEIRNQFVAVRLADGYVDPTLYDNKRDAVKYTDEMRHFYVCFRNILGGANSREMAVVIKFNRDARKAGIGNPDPDDQFGGKEALMTQARYDSDYRKLRRIVEFLRSEVALHRLREQLRDWQRN